MKALGSVTLARFALTCVLTCAVGALLPPRALAEPYESDPSAVARDEDYAAGKQAMEKKNWAEALKRYQVALRRNPDNADLHNYLGYSYRNVGQMDLAFKHYLRAIELDPRHRGAHEYIGEAYLMVKNLAKAQEHLIALEKICLLPCEELDDLKGKIAEYKKRGGR
jgi:tetratricopeptide (TPR) repeat protein